MPCHEITVNGIVYRGPLPGNSPSKPWKITAFLKSKSISESGQPVGKSWQTIGNYETEAAALLALDAIRASATGMS